MKKLIANIIALAAIILITSFTTYRVVMNHLIINEVDYGYTATVFGHTDTYVASEPLNAETTEDVELDSPASDTVIKFETIVDDESAIYRSRGYGYLLYSPITEDTAIEQLYCLSSDIDSFIAYMDEEGINYKTAGAAIYIDLYEVDTDRLIKTAMNCNCILKLQDCVATVTNIQFFPYITEEWCIEGVTVFN
jgi:hypothetical protein